VRDLFVVDELRADVSYMNTRAPPHEGAARARANCDELWRDFEPYASDHFLAEFPYRFHQRWFEMYLVGILRAGLAIQCPANSAPDVRVQHGDWRVLWLEAVAPTGGDESNRDRVVQPRPAPGESSVAYYVATDPVTMRVSGALHDKAKRLMEYQERGVIGPEDQALVAINVHGIPHGVYDAERYGLGATYGHGPQVVTVDRKALEVTGSHIQYKPELRRSSGSTVDAAPFLHPGLEHVAGALVSGADAANCQHPLGVDFMVFPNQYATPTYTEGQLPLGREWRLQRVDGGCNYEVSEHQAWRRM
jgi:hypothetical protein